MIAANKPILTVPAGPEPDVVTGVQLMQGIGVRPAQGFWADAWATVVKKPAAMVALGWLAVVAFMAVFAPILASGHPIWLTATTPSGGTESFSPLWRSLTALDLVLLIGTLVGAVYIFLPGRSERARRAKHVLLAVIAAIAVVAISQIAQNILQSQAADAAARARTVALRTGITPDFVIPFVRRPSAGWVVGAIIAGAVGLVAAALAWVTRSGRTGPLVLTLAGCVLAAWAVGARWNRPLERWDYADRAEAGTVTSATYTAVPWSPLQRFSDLQRQPPGTVVRPDGTGQADAYRFRLGTDAFGSDVLSQLMHASRLSISIGVVSTGIALLIGVTMGALMGYFGGWIDLLLFRVVEIFMAVPVLFLLIVMVAVLPEQARTTYVMMAIIGCFTWTGMARFTRAEFMKLRNQDFVQAAQATGLPLWSVLFKHMLPNGVAPVLVDTSFAVAAAIGVEATLSYLGLGPSDSASWGKLLSSAVSTEGEFKWWLAVFPGAAIFLTVLSYNLLGEALRDAIDPKLKKARV